MIADRREAIEAAGFRNSGGAVLQQPTWRVWLLGDDWPNYAEFIGPVDGQAIHVDDADLASLKELGRLKFLDLNSTKVTGTGLTSLKGTKQPIHLRLERKEQISDIGLAESERNTAFGRPPIYGIRRLLTLASQISGVLAN